MTTAAESRARKARAIAERPFDKRPERAKVEAAHCYVCGTEMVSKVGGQRVKGGLCGNCISLVNRKRDEVIAARAKAAKRAVRPSS